MRTRTRIVYVSSALCVIVVVFALGRFSQTLTTSAEDTLTQSEPQSVIRIANFGRLGEEMADALLRKGSVHDKGLRVYTHDEWEYDYVLIGLGSANMGDEMPAINQRAERGYIIDSIVPLPGDANHRHVVFMRKMKQKRP